MTSRPKGLDKFYIGNKISDLNKGGIKRQAYQAELKQIYSQTNGRVKGVIRVID